MSTPREPEPSPGSAQALVRIARSVGSDNIATQGLFVGDRKGATSSCLASVRIVNVLWGLRVWTDSGATGAAFYEDTSGLEGPETVPPTGPRH